MTAALNVVTAELECVGCGATATVPPAGHPAPEGWLRDLILGRERDELIAHCPSCAAPLRRILERLDHRDHRTLARHARHPGSLTAPARTGEPVGCANTAPEKAA